VQSTPSGEVNWIIETKGRKWEGTTAKDEAIEHWCARISTATGAAWSYVRVDQIRFDSLKPVSLAQLTAAAELPGFVG
jgi:type III restriction enzyme